MLLRASGELAGNQVDVRAVTGAAAPAGSGVAHAERLLAFADAAVQGDDSALAGARDDLLAAVGPEGLVDAAAVVANFERMVRVADSTGIPLDAPVHAMTQDLRSEIGADAFESAGNTPPLGPVARWLGRILRPVAIRAFRLLGDRQRRRARS